MPNPTIKLKFIFAIEYDSKQRKNGTLELFHNLIGK